MDRALVFGTRCRGFESCLAHYALLLSIVSNEKEEMSATTVSTLPRLHHVMIAIPPASEPSARAFYVDILGLSEIPKPESLCGRGGLWLSTGSLDVHLGIDQDFHPARKAHIALQLDDLDRIKCKLNEFGYQVGPVECELPGFERFYVSDPFGNRIELMQPL